MQNLDQIRAKHALAAAAATKEVKGRTVHCFTRADVAGFPALIVQNGLLSAFAYATEKDKPTREGIKFACDRTADHLSRHGIPILAGKTTGPALIDALSTATSLDLQRATTETLAFFGFLKRFASKEQDDSLDTN